jgi:hypothetical protein
LETQISLEPFSSTSPSVEEESDEKFPGYSKPDLEIFSPSILVVSSVFQEMDDQKFNLKNSLELKRQTSKGGECIRDFAAPIGRSDILEHTSNIPPPIPKAKRLINISNLSCRKLSVQRALILVALQYNLFVPNLKIMWGGHLFSLDTLYPLPGSSWERHINRSDSFNTQDFDELLSNEETYSTMDLLNTAIMGLFDQVCHGKFDQMHLIEDFHRVIERAKAQCPIDCKNKEALDLLTEVVKDVEKFYQERLVDRKEYAWYLLEQRIAIAIDNSESTETFRHKEAPDFSIKLQIEEEVREFKFNWDLLVTQSVLFKKGYSEDKEGELLLEIEGGQPQDFEAIQIALNYLQNPGSLPSLEDKSFTELLDLRSQAVYFDIPLLTLICDKALILKFRNNELSNEDQEFIKKMHETCTLDLLLVEAIKIYFDDISYNYKYQELYQITEGFWE